MRGVHTYAILLGFAIGVASFLALRLPPLSVVLAIGGGAAGARCTDRCSVIGTELCRA